MINGERLVVQRIQFTWVISELIVGLKLIQNVPVVEFILAYFLAILWILLQYRARRRSR